MKLKATIEFTLQRAKAEDCGKASKPLGMLELLDGDGDRIAWIGEDNPQNQASDIIFGLLESAGLSAEISSK